MSRPKAVLLCPGRGSYGKDELGTLRQLEPSGELAEALTMAEEEREASGEVGIRELDEAERFRPSTHLAGRNAAELIYFCSLAHLDRLRKDYELIGVAGNSLGWYTALPASGALSPVEGLRLVRTMARLQELAIGGQLLTTVIDDEWQHNRSLEMALEDALEQTRALGDSHYVAESIRLGGHRVLAGTGKGIEELMARLPRVDSRSRRFPFVLAGHGPFHTRLCKHVSQRATVELESLAVRRPSVHLIDGRGNLHTPWSASPRELLDYTLGRQVSETFDFSAAVRTAMRELQPDVLLCAGPGTSLRAPIGHVVLQEGWRGIRSREELIASGTVAG